MDQQLNRRASCNSRCNAQQVLRVAAWDAMIVAACCCQLHGENRTHRPYSSARIGSLIAVLLTPRWHANLCRRRTERFLRWMRHSGRWLLPKSVCRSCQSEGLHHWRNTFHKQHRKPLGNFAAHRAFKRHPHRIGVVTSLCNDTTQPQQVFIFCSLITLMPSYPSPMLSEGP